MVQGISVQMINNQTTSNIRDNIRIEETIGTKIGIKTTETIGTKITMKVTEIIGTKINMKVVTETTETKITKHKINPNKDTVDMRDLNGIMPISIEMMATFKRGLETTETTGFIIGKSGPKGSMNVS